MPNSEKLRKLQDREHNPLIYDARMVAEFDAFRLVEAKVLWINRGWFISRGINVIDSDVKEDLNEWILDQFAYCVKSRDCDSNKFSDELFEFYADRYGGTGAVTHGGSGRVGIRGNFQVKGIGITPLVGDEADDLHSHGCLFLEEAIREAIYAEIACNEFSFGAIPVLAIIDTGLMHTFDPKQPGERRALLIRPHFIRPAHLQRAPFFEAGGRTRQEQLKDVMRTKFANQHITAAEIINFFEIAARQVACSKIVGISNGGFYSSNITLNGKIVDFGSMSSIECRHRGRFFDTSDDLRLLSGIADSISFYFNKYSMGDDCLDVSDVVVRMAESCNDELLSRSIALFGLLPDEVGGLTEELLDLVDRYHSRNSEFTFPLSGITVTDVGKLLKLGGDVEWARSLATAVDSICSLGSLLKSDSGRRLRMQRAMVRLLSRRVELDREVLQRWIYEYVSARDNAGCIDQNHVCDSIAYYVAIATRHQHVTSSDDVVVAQTTDGTSWAILCEREGCSSARYFILDGPETPDGVLIFGEFIDRDAIVLTSIGSDINSSRIISEEFSARNDGSYEIRIAGRCISTTPMYISFF